MAIRKLLDLPSSGSLLCIAYVICLTLLCASAFPMKKAEDYGELYDLAGGKGENLLLKEEERRGSAPMWFHRNGKAVHSAPMWFNRMARSGEYNPEGEENISKTPPLWFHRVGKASAPLWFHRPGRGSAPLWFHRPGRNSLADLTPEEMAIIQDILDKNES